MSGELLTEEERIAYSTYSSCRDGRYVADIGGWMVDEQSRI